MLWGPLLWETGTGQTYRTGVQERCTGQVIPFRFSAVLPAWAARTAQSIVTCTNFPQECVPVPSGHTRRQLLADIPPQPGQDCCVQSLSSAVIVRQMRDLRTVSYTPLLHPSGFGPGALGGVGPGRDMMGKGWVTPDRAGGSGGLGEQWEKDGRGRIGGDGTAGKVFSVGVPHLSPGPPNPVPEAQSHPRCPRCCGGQAIAQCQLRGAPG